MPRIPLYNQGLGPSVQMATGQLSPRASAQAMAAPGQAMAGLGRVIQQTAQVGAKFEMERQKREAEDLQLIMDRKLSEQASDLNRDGTLRDVDSYRSAFDGLQTKLFSDVDAMERLNAGQKRAIKRGLTAKGNVLRATGSEQAHGFYLQDATNNFNQYTDTKLAESRTDFGVPALEVSIAEYTERYNSAIQKGLRPRLSPEQYAFEIYKQDVAISSRDEAQSLSDLEQKRQKIENGYDEFQRFSEDDRARLSNILTKQINFLTNEAVVAAVSSGQDNLVSLRNATDTIKDGQLVVTKEEKRELASEKIEDSVQTLYKYGQPEAAAKLDVAHTATKLTVEKMDKLVFAPPTEVRDALEAARRATENAVGTDRAYETEQAYIKLKESVDDRNQAVEEDGAGWVVGAFTSEFGRRPNQKEILQKLKLMAVPEANIKVLPNQEAQAIVARLGAESDPIEVARIFSAAADSDEMEPIVMRQLIASGAPLAANFVANMPNSPSAGMLLASSKEGAITQKYSNQFLATVRQTVRTDDVMDAHIKSMLGATFVDFNDNDLVRPASDNIAMNSMREANIDMVTQLTLYMMDQDGLVFSLSGENAVSPSLIRDYAQKASTIYSERYFYIEGEDAFENKQVNLRVPLHMASQKSEIRDYLKIFTQELMPGNIYYPGDVQAKKQYVDEIKGGYGWIASQDGKGAFLLDKTGGLVFELVSTPGALQKQPIRVNFSDAVADYPIIKEASQEQRSKEFKKRSLTGGLRTGTR